jgi:protein-tyrosine phosphatase
MNWILDNVAIGSWRDASNSSLLKNEGIKAILNVRADEDDPIKKENNEREKKYCIANGINYCHLPVPDSTVATDDQLIRGIVFIERNVRLGRRILVHCGEGLGRSPSFVAAYLIFKGNTSEKAVDLMKKKRCRSFEGSDSIHIPRLKRFEAELTSKLPQIDKLMESDLEDLCCGSS